MQTKIILLTGRKQSGKDTSCDAIISYLNDCISYLLNTDHCHLDNITYNKILNYKYKRYSFADSLKQFLIDVFGLTYNQCYGSDADKNSDTKLIWVNLPFDVDTIKKLFSQARPNVTIDLFLPMTAREVMQIFGSNICRKMYNDCWAQNTRKRIEKEQPNFALITDCRFPNEVEVFKDLNPIIIRLERNPFQSNHISEISLDKYNFEQYENFIRIDNNNLSLEEKNKIVVDYIKNILE